jgi:hypothetical protein
MMRAGFAIAATLVMTPPTLTMKKFDIAKLKQTHDG